MHLITPKEKSGLEKAIDRSLSELESADPDGEIYATIVSNLETLYKLKAIDQPQRVSRDTLLLVAGNLAGIVLIVSYERVNILTSKALSFLVKAH
jgi:hypothetical protein